MPAVIKQSSMDDFVDYIRKTKKITEKRNPLKMVLISKCIHNQSLTFYKESYKNSNILK